LLFAWLLGLRALLWLSARALLRGTARPAAEALELRAEVRLAVRLDDPFRALLALAARLVLPTLRLLRVSVVLRDDFVRELPFFVAPVGIRSFSP
jgi:hypothetical protein